MRRGEEIRPNMRRDWTIDRATQIEPRAVGNYTRTMLRPVRYLVQILILAIT